MNSSSEENEGKDLLDEIYGEVPAHSLDSVREFKPWHHPRKHWVRINQLCKLARALVRESHFPNNVFTYLTLPGEELIDIQSLEGTITGGSEEILDVHAVEGIFNSTNDEYLKLKYIGFNGFGNNPKKRAALELAKSIVNDSVRIHNGSRIENELVQAIANKKSKSYQLVRNHGPYNVINLDLCGSIADTAPGSSNSYFQALVELLEIQRDHMAQPFLLLIATRTHPSDIEKEALSRITDVYSSNLRSREFRGVFEEMIKERAEILLAKIQKGEEVSQDVLNKVFGVGIGKWLLHLMKPTTPYWDVFLEDICCYSIGDSEKDNMLSLAFKFVKVKQPIKDDYGITKQQEIENHMVTESVLAQKMLEKSKSIVNVDDLLGASPETRNKIITRAGKFLTKFGYSEEDYLKWANSKFTSIQGVA
ncbi:MAG: PP_RS20740 family protein [Imperialibacter sp.]|uniref:PP_RS20740 family protein n=1 Tax=Imperialibacter sp. TaxID=2038411 RepID=UPI003A881C81